ncbi:oligopeptide ABC transporter permease [Peribacillus sp. SCS-37]|uniref:oligopeptide ABC transporter permease n=1 Tax=Paraperibacillus esterisolvens TaxID=3115296 RepID=UPI0039069BAB
MLRYTFERILYMIITLFIIASLTFFLMKLLPGSPLKNQEKLSPEQVQLINQKYGLDKPLPVQYIRYLSNLAKGDLGFSFQYDNRTVTQLISDRIGPSAQLGFQALIVGSILGLLLGILAAIKHNTIFDYGATVLSVLGISIPAFVFAGFLQYFLGVKLELLPVALWEGFTYTIMPTIALSGFVIANISRFMRTELIEVMNSDYIMLAKAKGISQRGIIYKHAVRNALIPVITIIGPLAVNIMVGSLVIERIFGIPGLGEQFVRSITMNDYTVIMGTTIFYSALFVLIIFVVDVLYGIVDPRIRLSVKR